MSARQTEAAQRLPRGKLPPEIVVASQRARLIDAMVEVAAESGYSGSSVQQVLERAGVSRTTFYELFDGRLDCLLAAFDHIVSELQNQVRTACRGQDHWPAQVRAAVGAVLRWLADHPSAARVALVEVNGVGPVALKRHRQAVQGLMGYLEDGYEMSEIGRNLSPALPRMAIGSATSIMTSEVRAGRTEDLPGVIDDVVFAILVLFMGAEDASAEARSANG